MMLQGVDLHSVYDDWSKAGYAAHLYPETIPGNRVNKVASDGSGDRHTPEVADYGCIWDPSKDRLAVDWIHQVCLPPHGLGTGSEGHIGQCLKTKVKKTDPARVRCRQSCIVDTCRQRIAARPAATSRSLGNRICGSSQAKMIRTQRIRSYWLCIHR